MITVIIAAICAIAIAAVIVRVLESTQAPALRMIAAERRRNWEARRRFARHS